MIAQNVNKSNLQSGAVISLHQYVSGDVKMLAETESCWCLQVSRRIRFRHEPTLGLMISAVITQLDTNLLAKDTYGHVWVKHSFAETEPSVSHALQHTIYTSPMRTIEGFLTSTPLVACEVHRFLTAHLQIQLLIGNYHAIGLLALFYSIHFKIRRIQS